MSGMLLVPDADLLEGPLAHYRDLLVLRWLCEQYAARTDHLEVLTGRKMRTTAALVKRMREMGHVQTWHIIASEPVWIIPTGKGLRSCGLAYRQMTPRSTHLPHLAAINDLRLYIQMRPPESLWVSRRQLMYERPKGVCMPDALTILEGREIAIEVRLETDPSRVVKMRLERLGKTLRRRGVLLRPGAAPPTESHTRAG